MPTSAAAPVDAALYETVYDFLVSTGHKATAQALVKEASLDEKKLKSAKVEKLATVFSSYKRPAEAAPGNTAKKAKNEDSDDSDSDSVEEKPAAKKGTPTPAAATKSPAPAKPTPAPAAAAKKTPTPAAKKADSDSSDSDSDSDDSSEDEKPAAKKGTPAPAPAAAAKKTPTPAAATKKTPTPAAKNDASSSSDSDSSDDEKPAAKKATPAPAAAAKAKTPTPATKKTSSSSSSDDSSDDEDDEEKPATKPAASSGSASKPATPAAGEFKAYIKGLPWKASEHEVKDFFKACGKALSVELPLDEGGRSSGTAYIKFAQRAELDKALELDGQIWPGTERWLKIQEGFDKPERASFGSGVRPEGCDTVFVGNLPWDVDEEQLGNVFAEAGGVARVRMATDESGAFKGFAHVQFFDGADTDKAVALAGTDVNGRQIRVDYAPPRDRSLGDGGRGGGRGGGRDGGGRGGRGSPTGRGGRGGRGAPSMAVSKNKGSIVAAAGSKVTFDD